MRRRRWRRKVVVPRETPQTVRDVKTFLLFYPFALPRPSVFHCRLFLLFLFSDRENSAISWFSQAEMYFTSSGPGIKFKWKLDVIPGEETAWWGIRMGRFGRVAEWDDSSVCSKIGFVFQRFRTYLRAANVSTRCSFDRQVVRPPPACTPPPCSCWFIPISFVLGLRPPHSSPSSPRLP